MHVLCHHIRLNGYRYEHDLMKGQEWDLALIPSKEQPSAVDCRAVM